MEWPVKRFYKFMLKRLIGHLLEDELNLQQLDVQIGSGTVELRDLKLSSVALNNMLGSLPFDIELGTLPGGLLRAALGAIFEPALTPLRLCPRPHAPLTLQALSGISV